MNFLWISQTPSVNFPWNLAHFKNSTVKSRFFSRELGWSLMTSLAYCRHLIVHPSACLLYTVLIVIVYRCRTTPVWHYSYFCIGIMSVLCNVVGLHPLTSHSMAQICQHVEWDFFPVPNWLHTFSKAISYSVGWRPGSDPGSPDMIPTGFFLTSMDNCREIWFRWNTVEL